MRRCPAVFVDLGLQCRSDTGGELPTAVSMGGHSCNGGNRGDASGKRSQGATWHGIGCRFTRHGIRGCSGNKSGTLGQPDKVVNVRGDPPWNLLVAEAFYVTTQLRKGGNVGHG